MQDAGFSCSTYKARIDADKTMRADITTSMLELSTQILHDLAAGSPPAELAARLCLLVERQTPGRIASILVMREDERLHVLAAPSAPSSLLDAFENLEPGPHAGSCGNALYLREPCMVSDIAHDARWDELREVADIWSLQSCWSWPIWRDERILGTFALTGVQAGSPTALDMELLEFSASLAGALLSAHSLLQQNQASMALQQAMLDNSLVAIALVHKRVIRHANRRMAEMFGFPGPESLIGQPSEIIYPSHAAYALIGTELYPPCCAAKTCTANFSYAAPTAPCSGVNSLGAMCAP